MSDPDLQAIEIIRFLESNRKDEFSKLQKKIYKRFDRYCSKSDLLHIYLNALNNDDIQENPIVEKLLRIKSTRSNSGELEMSTMLPPDNFSCKYDCSMCPDERKVNGASVDMSRSYLSSEGTPKLGLIEDFSGIFQVWRRCIQYEYLMGHKIDKIIHILLGGTFHSYNKKIRDDYIHDLYFACNTYNEYLSFRNKGKFKKTIIEWLKQNPFEEKISFKNTIGESLLAMMRSKKDFEEEKKINSLLKSGRITGLVIETRPDQISLSSLKELRHYGVTRVQIGVQHTDDTVLHIMNRRHTVSASIKAIRYLKDAGFKIDIHVLLDCPGSTIEKDYECAKTIFSDEHFKPDYVKLYICVDVPFTKNRLYKKNYDCLPVEIRNDVLSSMENGNWKKLKEIARSLGYQDFRDVMVWEPKAEHDYQNFKKMLTNVISLIPEYVRLNRFHRDFPRAESAPLRLGYESDTLKTNLQQICMDELEKEGAHSKDIRSRELRNHDINLSACKLFVHKYKSYGGVDIFISIEECLPKSDKTRIIGMMRCRVTDWDMGCDPKHKYYPPYWFLKVFQKKSLRIRELHIYGNLQSKNTDTHGQHMGFGRFLLKIAEIIAIIMGLDQVVIISGVGVQKYYENQGYTLSKDDEYEVKNISDQELPYFISLQNRWISVHQLKKLFLLNEVDSYDKNIIEFNSLTFWEKIILSLLRIFYFFLKLFKNTTYK